MEIDQAATSSVAAVNTTKDDNFETVFYRLIGGFGPWQRRVMLLVFVLNIVGMWQNLSITFQALPMRYWCVAVESHRFQDLDLAANRNRTNQCFVTVPSGNGTEKLLPCIKWDFDLKNHAPTIVSEWDLVCDRSWMVSFSKSIFMIGFLTGVFTMGHLSDWIGRFPTLLVCYGVTLVSSLASVAIKSYTDFVVLRFILALGRGALSTIAYVVLIEIIGGEYRSLVSIIFLLGWTAGFATLPALAWLIPHWYWLQLAIVLPIVPFFVIYWIVPESPRWLLAHSKTERFHTIFTKAVKLNKTDAKATDIVRVCDNFHKVKQEEIKTFINLYRMPGFRKKTFIISLAWAINSLLFYSISYNVSSFGFNVYINQFLMGILEVPTFALCFFAIKRIGRKKPVIFCMVTGGVFFATLMFVPLHYESSRSAIANLVKSLITGSFGLMYLLTSETFPTVARSTAIGYGSTMARVAAITAPFTKELGEKTHRAVPIIIVSVLVVTSGLLILLIPETQDQMMPDIYGDTQVDEATDSSKISPEADDK